MSALYPLVFEPRFKERVWGGRALQRLYGKALPEGVPIGESWEIADRAGDESVVTNGAFAGRTLRWLMEQHTDGLLGNARASADGRFPLLCKILDARDTLSLQVHPPPRARHLGDPKTEMWYIASAEPGAELYVGLKRGVTREQFESAIASGLAAECVHRIPVQAGDTMFLPSGRVHAIGAGLVIFEIQQNSDTTFRVFDWNRPGLDGRPRPLHVAESLDSIDFSDAEPALAAAAPHRVGELSVTPLVSDPLFNAELVRAEARAILPLTPPRLRVIAVVERRLVLNGGGAGIELRAGQFALVPAATDDAVLTLGRGARVLVVEAGE
jgi:mannose-6-phosphate isomerase